MSNYDFFAQTATIAPPPSPAVKAPFQLRGWHIAVAAVVLAATAATVVVLLLSGSSKPGRPDPGTARIFGQQARAELPAPVTADECLSAMRAFPAIANDQTASAAFLAGCES
jgi:hypothetical protein